MPDNERKLRVFLCHSSQDKPVVRELYQRLLAEGWIDPWLDKEKLLPGQAWELEIEKSVESADVVIVCLSKESVEKEGYYQKEIRKILDVAEEKPEGTIYVILLRLDECQVPHRLSKWQCEDYFPKDNKDTSYDRILISLKLRASILSLPVGEKVDKKSSHRVGKEVIFYLNTSSRVFIDWFYQNYFYKDLPIDQRKNLPPKASDYFYKPIGPYNDDDPIPIRLISERIIDGRIYKGAFVLAIETLSLTRNPRICVTMGFDEDDFFLVFYRGLAKIASVYQESRGLIMPYLAKYKDEYEMINPENHN